MPLALSLGVILEEGFPIADLERIIKSISISSKIAGVAIVTGDTKVVPKGTINGICLNTSGIGLVPKGVEISGANIRPEDVVIVSGNLGEHDLATRFCNGLADFGGSIIKPLHMMIGELLDSFPGAVHALRDTTRGGLATSLVWLASASGVCLEIDETALPIPDRVRELCVKEKISPLHLNSEGRCILCCAPEFALDILARMRRMEAGSGACIIGHASPSPMGRVKMHDKGCHSFLETL